MSKLNLIDVSKALGWRIAEGSSYNWLSYGPQCRYFDFSDSIEESKWYISIIANVETLEIREVTGYGSIYELVASPWKWIDNQYSDAYLNECKERQLRPDIAWDDVKYYNVESVDELQKLIDMVGAIDNV